MDNTLVDINKLKPDVPPELKPVIKVYPYVAPVIVDNVDSTDKQMIANSALDSSNTNRPVDKNIDQVTDSDPVVPTDPEPFIILPEMPVFPGGPNALMKYINDNIIYPSSAVDNGIEGKVILRFVVWTDGSVRRIEILRGADPLLDQEAVRVISQMPKWKPGKNNGTPAAVWFSVPVTFRLKKT
jgi:protein TonB